MTKKRKERKVPVEDQIPTEETSVEETKTEQSTDAEAIVALDAVIADLRNDTIHKSPKHVFDRLADELERVKALIV